MKYQEVRNIISDLMTSNKKEFIMALMSIETGQKDIQILEAKYEEYINNEDFKLLDDEFYMWKF